jgi:hypothetical protein
MQQIQINLKRLVSKSQIYWLEYNRPFLIMSLMFLPIDFIQFSFL